MTAVWYWFGRTLRSRLRSYAGVALLLALLGGLAMASLAGARRTASAYPRFLDDRGAMDLQVNAGDFEIENPDIARRIPGVTATASYMAFLAYPLDEAGRPDPALLSLEAAGSIDGLYFQRDRFTVTSGRLPDPANPNEVAVNRHLATAADIAVGRRLDIGVFRIADEEAIYGDDPPVAAERVPVTVVGIGVFPAEVIQDDVDRLHRMLFTPAFTARVKEHGTYSWTGVDVSEEAGGVPAFKAAYLGELPGETRASFRETSVVTERTQQAIRPLATALAIFGALAAVATLLLVGQSLLRLLRVDRQDLSTLRAMGAGPGLTAAIALPGAVVPLVVGVAGAVAVAVALSPLAPIGPLHRVEADPGLSFDGLVLGGGAAALLLGLGLVTVVLAFRHSPHRDQMRTGQTARPSTMIRAASAAGLPLPAVTGMRLGLEGGAGRAAAPVRAAAAGAVVAVVALVAALVFGNSLRSLVDEPRLYGWDWDITVLDQAGYGDIDVTKAAALLDGDGAVSDWTGVYFQSADLDGRDVSVIGIRQDATVTPPLLAGRGLRAPDEIVLGSRTLGELGKEIGDDVVLDPAGQARRLRIVGTAVFPTLGPVLAAYPSLGDGALAVYDQLPGWDQISPGPKALLIRFAEGADQKAATARIEAGITDIGFFPGSAETGPAQRPAEIVNYDAMGSTPAVLAGVLTLAAVVSLGLTLASVVTRRRRELSTLKALGFTRRQVSATVVWQSSIVVATGLLVGVPVGVALGRWLWALFAERLPVVARPSVPVLVVVALAGALLVLGNLAAAIPARRAGRAPVAAVLRSE